MQWDVFISHAREDHVAVARPLAEALRQHGLAVWLDGQELAPGDSVRGKVNDGLARSRWGVLIITPAFLAMDGPQAELDGLLAREITGERILIPVWHGVTAAEVARRSPMLAARLAIGTGRGKDAVRAAILASIGRDASLPVGQARRTSLIPLWLSLLEDPGFSLGQVRHHLARRESYAGQPVGGYTLRELVGVGGSGAVFRAVHAALGRQVALKLFFPFGDDVRTVRAATERAVRGLSSLRHPGVAALLDYGYLRISIGAAPYLVYDYVDGVSLLDWSRGLEREPDHSAVLARRLEVAVRAAQALHQAHGCRVVEADGSSRSGVMHGDLKPSNVLVRRQDEQPVLMDFMMPDIQRMAAERLTSWNSWEKDTEGRYQEIGADHPFGAPGYVPPEHRVNDAVTPAWDVYGLGRTFEDLFWPVRRASDTGDPRATEAGLRRLVDAMTAPLPEDRLATIGDVVERLRALRAAHAAGVPARA